MDEASSPLRHRNMTLVSDPSPGRHKNQTTPSSSPPSNRKPSTIKGIQRRTNAFSPCLALSDNIKWVVLITFAIGIFTFQAKIFSCVKDSLEQTHAQSGQGFSLSMFVLQSDVDSSSHDGVLLRQANKKIHPLHLSGRNMRRRKHKKNHDVTANTAEQTSDDAKSTSNERSKPILYLDIGPFKTGSSFLQCALSRNGYDLLKQDNGASHWNREGTLQVSCCVIHGLCLTLCSISVLYLGTCANECIDSIEKYEFCLLHSGAAVFHQDEKLHKIGMDRKLQRKLKELAKANRSALMVWEYFGDRSDTLIQQFVKVASPGFDIRIIVHYRRLYDWLPSMYDQLHRPKWNGHEQYMIWPNDKWTRRSGNDVRGKIRFPFDVYDISEQKTMGLDPGYRGTFGRIKKTGRHPTSNAIERWSKYVPNITVVDMHHLPGSGGGDPLLTHLFCHVIPSLTHTCEAIQHNQLELLEAGRNTRYHADSYDLLAVQAHQQGLHPHGIAQLTRSDAIQLIQFHQEVKLSKSSNDFPLSCMSVQSLHSLLNLSMTAEADLFRDMEDDHKQGFQEAVEKRKFCNIDVNRTLQDKDWRNFFRPFVSVAPHVLERDSKGRWKPTMDGTTKSIRDLLFAFQLGRPIDPEYPQLEFLGFLDSPGTGMATLAELLQRIQANQHYDTYLDFALYRKERVGDPSFSASACIFGSQRASATAANLQDSATTPRPCPSTTYETLVREFLASLPYITVPGQMMARNATIWPAVETSPPTIDHAKDLQQSGNSNSSLGGLVPTPKPADPPDDDDSVGGDDTDEESDDGGVRAGGGGAEGSDDESGAYADDGGTTNALDLSKRSYEELQVSLTTILMVRNPFYRWADLVVSIAPQDEPMVQTISQLVEAHDASRWLDWMNHTNARSLVESGSATNQYRTLSSEVDDAIKMIHGSTANVLVMLHECWDASMYLLQDRHPAIVDETAIHQLLSQGRSSNYLPFFCLNEQQQSSEAWKTLHDQARQKWSKDYVFYDAAVTQFRKLLSVSNNVPTQVQQECLEVLGCK